MSLATESIPAEIKAVLYDALSPVDVDVMRVAEDLYGVADLLHADQRLRQAMTDPSRSASDKQDLVTQAFGSVVQAATKAVLDAVVASHWSKNADLGGVVEACGVRATFIAAKNAGKLVDVEHELLQIQDLLADNRELRMRLSDMGVGDPHERGDLAQAIFAPHLSVFAMRLLRRAVGRSAHGRLLAKLRTYAELAAAIEKRALVTVEVAAPLSVEQTARLRTLMSKRLGTDVTLAVTVNPTVLGGFRLLSGDEAVDASVSARVEHLRRTLVG